MYPLCVYLSLLEHISVYLDILVYGCVLQKNRCTLHLGSLYAIYELIFKTG